MSTDPRLPDRDYPLAHELREGLNHSHRRLNLINLAQLILGALAFAAIAICLWL